MIKELERERDDWRNIYEGYEISEEEGRKRQEGKEERCGLCQEYQASVVFGDHSFLTCRACPVVILTGRTCAHHWNEVGIQPGEQTAALAEKTYLFMDKLIEAVN